MVRVVTDPAPSPAWRNRIAGHGKEAPDQLLANPENWRIHPKAQQDALSGVLDEVGWVQEVIVNRITGHVVDGHPRVSLAISREEAAVPVKYAELTPGEEALVLAALDPLAGMAATAKDALESLLAEVQPGSGAVTALLEDVARGAGLDGAKEGLMVFTDPPYGISYQSRVDEKRRKPWGGIEGDDLRGAELQALLMAIPQTEPRYICSQWESLPDLWATHGKPRNIIIWDKRWAGLGKGYRRQHEIAAFYGKLNITAETDVWSLDRALDYEHPAQKPVMLVERALGNSPVSGDAIIGPFPGSGTTMIAAERLGRRCYGMEIAEQYTGVSVRRWQDFTGRDATLEATGEAFAHVAEHGRDGSRKNGKRRERRGQPSGGHRRGKS